MLNEYSFCPHQQPLCRMKPENRWPSPIPSVSSWEDGGPEKVCHFPKSHSDLWVGLWKMGRGTAQGTSPLLLPPVSGQAPWGRLPPALVVSFLESSSLTISASPRQGT